MVPGIASIFAALKSNNSLQSLNVSVQIPLFFPVKVPITVFCYQGNPIGSVTKEVLEYFDDNFTMWDVRGLPKHPTLGRILKRNEKLVAERRFKATKVACGLQF